MAICVKNLNYVYMAGTPFEKQALKDVSFEIKDGEFVGIIGHTGSGKSTLIQHFNGLVQPTSGDVLVNGKSITQKGESLRELRTQVGLVFQYPEHQLFEETVYADIAFGPRNMGLTESEVEERVMTALEGVGLSDSLLDKSPFELSGGQKRRVAIAGVLAMKPKILILDEPAAGLDPAGRNEILSELRALYEAGDITIILVSHSMEDIAKIAKRIIVMADGKVAMDGTPSEIFSHAKELKSLGLGVPQVSELISELAARGLNINRDIYTVRETKQAILELIEKHQEGGDANA